MANPKGYTLHSDATITVIATMNSANVKTGDMVQVWILRTDMNPVEAVKTGDDSAICGTCVHRGDKENGRKRSCYVNVGQGPNSVWKAFTRGNYPLLPLSEYSRVFGGRAVRLGAYGDPAVMPRVIVETICRVASRHTGYTHQWRTNEWIKAFCMASCDTVADYKEATANGWRTFRVSVGMTPQNGEILCPASEQGGYKTQCAKCGLCNGASEATRKNIYIPVHGSGASNAFTILN